MGANDLTLELLCRQKFLDRKIANCKGRRTNVRNLLLVSIVTKSLKFRAPNRRVRPPGISTL